MSENTNSQKAPQRKNGANMVDKFGDLAIVGASLNQLYSFLLRQLNYLSARRESDFGSIVSWSTKMLPVITNSRSEIWECLEDIAYNCARSGWCKILDCKKRYNVEGESYCYCGWFDSPNHVSKKFVEENPMTLGQGRCCHLLEEMCHRFERVIKRIEHEGTCELDIEITEFFTNQYKIYDTACSQAWTEVNKLESFRLERGSSENSDSRSNKFGNRHGQKTQPRKTQSNQKTTGKSETSTKETKVDNVEVPKVVRLPPSKPVTAAFSYANMASGTKSVGSVKPAAVSNSNIVNVDDSCPPVEDLNVEANKESVSQCTVTETSETTVLTKKDKKALKRAAQRKRKAAIQESGVMDLTNELPTDAMELHVEPKPVESKPAAPKQVAKPAPKPVVPKPAESQSKPSELVEVEMMRLIDGKPVYSKVVMSRAEYASIQSTPL